MSMTLLGVGGETTGTTWDPTTKDAGIALSSGNLVATHTTSTADELVLSTTGKLSGTPSAIITVGVTTLQYVGLISAARGAAGATLLFNGDLYVNSVFLSNIGVPYNAGDSVQISPNFTTNRLQFKINGGSGLPAAGGGADISGIVTVPLFIFAGMTANGTVATADFTSWV
jgi:hypothetical protein